MKTYTKKLGMFGGITYREEATGKDIPEDELNTDYQQMLLEVESGEAEIQ